MAAGNSDDLPNLWQPQPQAFRVVEQLVAEGLEANDWLSGFCQRLLEETGTRLIDWLDHLVISDAQPLADVGFQWQPQLAVLAHGGGLFPRLVVEPHQTDPLLALKVQEVDAFLRANQLLKQATIEGAPADRLRVATVRIGDVPFRVVERHGYQGLELDASPATDAEQISWGWRQLRDRSRDYDNPGSCFEDALTRYRQVADMIGADRATDLFFGTEREYWQARNRAARVQYERQNAFGLGWANHDHHTYRSSRPWFAPLVAFLESTGCYCRERFYAGSDAGWGAQVLEHDACGVVIFADVDMTEQEITGDFAHDGLPAQQPLGTVGLWCQLHGDSFLAAGMHHLECQFNFDAAREQLAREGIPSMAPFTDFPYLRQAFTEGERWQVPADRLASLVNSGVLSAQEAAQFESQGALGSHLEILERNDGYKGFNQTGISKIIRETNPRLAWG